MISRQNKSGRDQAKTTLLVLSIHLILASGLVLPGTGLAAQSHVLPIEVDSSLAARLDHPVDAPVDLTSYMTLVGGSLDLGTLQVAEVDSSGTPLDPGVLFQFDPDPGFDPALQASGTLVFVMDGVTPAVTTRYYQLWFDVIGACGDCPSPPAVPVPVTVDSLTYENQLTYVVDTPRAVYKYHTEGAGLASMIDNDSQDWIAFHDIAGSKSAGEYRGLPNLVFQSGQLENSFFHPGFTNAHSNIVNSGPLKVTVFSETDVPGNLWQVLWEFYPTFARITVQTVGTSNGGDYWFLYEGVVGGLMDAGDEVIRSSGPQTSAFDYAFSWEEVLPVPSWVYFRDLSAPRILYLSDDMGDADEDSYRPQGQTSGSTPEMTVFGFGRVLNTSPDKLVPRMSGAGRTFTFGFGEDYTAAGGAIAAASKPLTIVVGNPYGGPSPVGDDGVPGAAILQQNFPNPFNPRTVISFSLPVSSRVRLDILDLRGRMVANLVDGVMAPGSHSVTFDGKDLPSGIYISRLTTGQGSRERKMTLLR
ncbi:MAG: T9SS type A sorting domain-containing protein [Candidatus Krumholzibacteriota bacterium]